MLLSAYLSYITSSAAGILTVNLTVASRLQCIDDSSLTFQLILLWELLKFLMLFLAFSILTTFDASANFSVGIVQVFNVPRL